MKFKTTFITTLLFLFIFSLGSDLQAQEKKWEVDLSDKLYKVGWILQSNEGYIIASGDKGLLAMNNETGEVVWHNEELKGVDKNSFLNIDGLPMFYADYTPMVGKTRGLLINSSTGDIIFDTKDEGYRIKAFNLYPERSCILFEAMKGNEQMLMKFSLKTWEQEWLASVGETKGLIGKAKGALSSASFIKFGPYFTTGNQLILGKKDKILSFDFNTGALSWEQESKKKIKALVYSDLNDKIYLGIRKSSKLTVLDPSSGKDITPGKLKLRGSLLDVRADENNNLILVETEGFNLIDPKTETFKWKKSFKIDYLDEVIPYKDNYIAIGKNEKNGSIALVGKDGKKIWDSKVKGYSYYATPTNNGVLYISTERSNILSYADGKDLWKKDVKFKSIPAVTYDEKEDKAVVFENKKAYRFDLNTGEIELFAEDVELEKVNKKTPLTASYIDGNYFIGTDQHASLLSADGKLVYTKYFDPVNSVKGLMGLAEMTASATLGVDLDIQGSIDNINQLTALSNGSYRSSKDQTDAKSTTTVAAGLYVGTTSGQMAPVFEITNSRYFNSKSTTDHQFIVTKVKEDGAYIYQLNKLTGKIDNKIKLTDKTPNYILDDIDTRVFLNEKNKMITCYQL